MQEVCGPLSSPKAGTGCPGSHISAVGLLPAWPIPALKRGCTVRAHAGLPAGVPGLHNWATSQPFAEPESQGPKPLGG